MQLLEGAHDIFSMHSVEVAGGFVGEDQGGPVHDGPGHGHPLLLPAGKLGREVALAVRHMHAFEGSSYPYLAFGWTHTGIHERERDVVEDAQLIDQVEALEDKADVALAQLGSAALVVAGDFLALESVRASIGGIDQAQDVEKGRFATARGPHDRDEFPLTDFQVDLMQGGCFDQVRPVNPGKLVEV